MTDDDPKVELAHKPTILSALARYATAPVVSALVGIVQELLNPRPEIAPFVLFSAGVAAVAGYAGRGPGLVTTLLSAAIGNYFFTAPFGRITLEGPALVGTTMFLVSGTVVSLFCGAMRSAMQDVTEKAAALRARDFISSGRAQLGAEVKGELSEEATASRLLAFVAHYLGAQVGVLYELEDAGAARRIATFACAESGAGAPPAWLKPGEGWVGQVALEGQLVALADVPDDHVKIVSATGQSRPRHLLIAPLTGSGRTVGVVELGFLATPHPSAAALLGAVAELAGVTLLSARYRARQQALLDETLRQSEELQAQQEELRVANEELESQSKVLRDSQGRLEAQQAELEQTNSQLEEQAQALEQQRDDLSHAQVALVEKAEELGRINQYKSEFLANMSHELRTPLNSALILAKLLGDNKDGNLTPEQIKYANTIYTAGNDLLALINDILDLSRIEAGRVEVHPEAIEIGPVVEAIKRVFVPVAAEKNLRFAVAVEPGVASPMTTDPLRLQQILRNLLSNAFKFTEAGEVALTVAPAPGDRVSFVVRDTGVGIPAMQHEIIFEAFRQADGTTQRKYGGTGLGLTISRQLARRLGGEIAVTSAAGQGSTFTLVLPAHLHEASQPPEEPRRAAPEPPAAGPARGRKATPAVELVRRAAVQDDRESVEPGDKTIMVVEDDEAFARIVRDIAREQRFKCLVATTAGEGIDLAERFVPSAAILDVKLPDGSGLAVLEHLKRHPATRHIPVHVVSADDYAQQALELGAVGHAIKPVMREQLIAAFGRLEEKLAQKIRRVLVVEDVAVQRESIVALLTTTSAHVVSVATAGEALDRLKQSTFDAMVLDLKLPDMSGYELLDRMAAGEAFSFPPVIVYTGRALSRDEEQRLRRHASSIIIKGARSPERLLDEVTLFLHQVEKELPAEQQRILKEVRSREAALEGKTILVVEDDVRNVFALSSVLEPRGVKVRIARNGREALEALDLAARDPAASVDLVLMDLMMPEMDGLSATREIRKRPEHKKLPIIALTAKAMPDDREKCLQAGANDYIAKPLDVDKLVSLIKVWMPK